MRYLICLFLLAACSQPKPKPVPTAEERYEAGYRKMTEQLSLTEPEDLDPYIVGVLQALRDELRRQEIQAVIDEARAEREERTRFSPSGI